MKRNTTLLVLLLMASTSSVAASWPGSLQSTTFNGYTVSAQCGFNWNYSKAQVAAATIGGYYNNNHHVYININAGGTGNYGYSNSKILYGSSTVNAYFVNIYDFASPYYYRTTGRWWWKKKVKTQREFTINANGSYRNSNGGASITLETASRCVWSNLTSYQISQLEANGTID